MNVTIVPSWKHGRRLTGEGYFWGSEPASKQPEAADRTFWHLRAAEGEKNPDIT